MPKAKVSWLLCIGRLVSKTDNVMHFARLVEQASVTRFCDLFVFGAYIYLVTPALPSTPRWANYRNDDIVPFFQQWKTFDGEVLPEQVAYVTAYVDR